MQSPAPKRVRVRTSSELKSIAATRKFHLILVSLQNPTESRSFAANSKILAANPCQKNPPNSTSQKQRIDCVTQNKPSPATFSSAIRFPCTKLSKFSLLASGEDHQNLSQRAEEFACISTLQWSGPTRRLKVYLFRIVLFVADFVARLA